MIRETDRDRYGRQTEIDTGDRQRKIEETDRDRYGMRDRKTAIDYGDSQR